MAATQVGKKDGRFSNRDGRGVVSPQGSPPRNKKTPEGGLQWKRLAALKPLNLRRIVRGLHGDFSQANLLSKLLQFD